MKQNVGLNCDNFGKMRCNRFSECSKGLQTINVILKGGFSVHPDFFAKLYFEISVVLKAHSGSIVMNN